MLLPYLCFIAVSMLTASELAACMPALLLRLLCIRHLTDAPFHLSSFVMQELTSISIRDKASASQPEPARNGASYSFEWVIGLLYLECIASTRPGKLGTRTQAIPAGCPRIVIQVGHEGHLAFHFSHRRTEWKTSKLIFWPGM